MQYGSEFLINHIIQQDWDFDQLKELILTMQELLREFVTDPETGDIRFITQPVFLIRILPAILRGKKENF